jgi:hypothetical protein
MPQIGRRYKVRGLTTRGVGAARNQRSVSIPVVVVEPDRVPAGRPSSMRGLDRAPDHGRVWPRQHRRRGVRYLTKRARWRRPRRVRIQTCAGRKRQHGQDAIPRREVRRQDQWPVRTSGVQPRHAQTARMAKRRAPLNRSQPTHQDTPPNPLHMHDPATAHQKRRRHRTPAPRPSPHMQQPTFAPNRQANRANPRPSSCEWENEQQATHHGNHKNTPWLTAKPHPAAPPDQRPSSSRSASTRGRRCRTRPNHPRSSRVNHSTQ